MQRHICLYAKTYLLVCKDVSACMQRCICLYAKTYLLICKDISAFMQKCICLYTKTYLLVYKDVSACMQRGICLYAKRYLLVYKHISACIQRCIDVNTSRIHLCINNQLPFQDLLSNCWFAIMECLLGSFTSHLYGQCMYHSNIITAISVAMKYSMFSQDFKYGLSFEAIGILNYLIARESNSKFLKLLVKLICYVTYGLSNTNEQ